MSEMTDRSDGALGRQSPPDRPAADAPRHTPDLGRHCARCAAAIRWRETKFCLDRRARFGGRVYCLACQSTFPAVEA